MTDPRPHLLFVCVKNGGKSQMAAALARQIAGDAVDVSSAGTSAGSRLNAESEAALVEVGATMAGQTPRQLTDAMLRQATHVVVVGTEAQVEVPADADAELRVWDVDEPSLRGIEGAERMRLVRDDITRRVLDLVMEVTGQPAENAERYRGIAADLAKKYDGVFTADEVRAVVREAHASLAARAKVTTFLPIFVERFAHDRLAARARTQGAPSEGKPELLFVCVHNAGRSQIAAAMARHFSAGGVNVRSAGSQPSGEINPMALEVLRERGIEVKGLFPKPLSTDVLQASDVVITMGCGDECPYYPGKRYEDWKVADPHGQGIEKVREVADDIERRIKDLLVDLGVPVVS